MYHHGRGRCTLFTMIPPREWQTNTIGRLDASESWGYVSVDQKDLLKT